MGTRSSRPVAIDLYAGVGGMSLGAARAGFEVRAAVELDLIAVDTHAVNFPTSRHLNWDIAGTSGSALLEAAGVRGKLDGLVGGPPCQGFSDIGKRAFDDPRNSLFADFFRLVNEIKPRFFVAENVPGILADRNRGILEAALAMVPSKYIMLEAREVAAHRLGAPTSRARVFFVGYDPDGMEPLSGQDLFEEVEETAAVTVGAALAGLPTVRCDWQTEAQGWRKVDRLPEDRPFYDKLMNAVPFGVGAPAALKRLHLSREVSGNMGTKHADDVVKRFRSLQPGERDPISRAPRLTENGFCPTLRAGTGSDRGSYQALRPIHFRSPRVITPREAARLQGFPDWFQFHGTKWHSFRQIGNSVSPIVAEALLSRICRKLE
jgi:DNA (cytosine-5)-methyltransferase 1